MHSLAVRALQCAMMIVTLVVVLACDEKKSIEQRKGRKEPICAVRDCTTGRIVDDGCDEGGRCASCVNACTSGDPPSAAPVTR